MLVLFHMFLYTAAYPTKNKIVFEKRTSQLNSSNKQSSGTSESSKGLGQHHKKLVDRVRINFAKLYREKLYDKIFYVLASPEWPL